ncbi:uncharacterized protein RHO25_013185 [Cercospora beticola]|uniref:Uncharacterized protein n=1 Tax=Cercospora beticola TaxID=122368 RepID=A0ABZ0P9H7_CERBT|nr:hypothetical protein RHO25_013185 [Cercospora beticola]
MASAAHFKRIVNIRDMADDEYPTVLGEDEDSADTEIGVGQAAVSSGFFGAVALPHAIPSPMTAIGLTTPPSSGGGVRHSTGIAIGFAAPVIG